MNQEIAPIAPDVIQACIDDAAPMYLCKESNCSCYPHRIFDGIQELLNDRNIVDRSAARAFALGVLSAYPILNAIQPASRKKADTFLSLWVVEALRRAGDVTDEQIEQACQKIEQRRKSDQAINASLQAIVNEFGQIPITTGSKRFDN